MVVVYRADESINCRWPHSRNTYHVELHVSTLLLHRVIISGLWTQCSEIPIICCWCSQQCAWVVGGFWLLCARWSISHLYNVRFTFILPATRLGRFFFYTCNHLWIWVLLSSFLLLNLFGVLQKTRCYLQAVRRTLRQSIIHAYKRGCFPLFPLNPQDPHKFVSVEIK